MKFMQRLFTAGFVMLGMFALAGTTVAAPKANHHNGQQLLGEHIKTNGNHKIHQKGLYAVSVDVRNGKVAGVHVKHAKLGDVAVKKYKTTKKLAQADEGQYGSTELTQLQDMGTVYIGYAYTDEYGYEEIYWFPYDMIFDGDTGAVEYYPVY
jgi:hypothetical protein